MAGGKPEFTNFRQAFCAYHRCPQESYARKALFFAIPPSRRLLALPIYLFNRRFFAIDFGIIESLGEARTAEEFSGFLEELANTTRVERSIRRGLLGIRISGARLLVAWEAVADYVLEPEAVAKGHVTPRPTVERTTQSNVQLKAQVKAPPKDLPTVIARRVHRAAVDITGGKPVEQAVLDAGLTGETEFLALLAQQASIDPALGWLDAQLRLSRRVVELEKENASLKTLVGEKDLQIQDLKKPGTSA